MKKNIIIAIIEISKIFTIISGVLSPKSKKNKIVEITNDTNRITDKLFKYFIIQVLYTNNIGFF